MCTVDVENSYNSVNEVAPEEMVICRMCKQHFPKSLIKCGRCIECRQIFEEWKNGRKQTTEEILKYGKRRTHYKYPQYVKVYTVYAYDKTKYSVIYKKLRELALRFNKPDIYFRVSPYRILSLCYLRDEQNALKSMGDEKHIFRLKNLDNIHKEIARVLLEDYGISKLKEVFLYIYKRTGLVIHLNESDNQAELIEVMTVSLKERLKVHITLLRALKSGYEIEDAVEYTKLEHQEIFKKLLVDNWRGLKDVYI